MDVGAITRRAFRSPSSPRSPRLDPPPGATTPRAILGIVLVALVPGGCGERTNPEDAPVPEEPTFSSDVGEILYRECTPCHREGGPAPFTLESYEDARIHSALIARVTEERRMPPWLPAPGDYAFADERNLSDREIQILRRWADQGAPEGAPRRAPEPPERAEGWMLGEPDLVLEMPEPFTVPAGDPGSHRAGLHHDVYRNFVLPVPLERTRYVRAVEFHPGDARVVHHAILSVDPTPRSRQEDARDPEPGFDGMFNRSAARAPGGFFIGWTPGHTPRPNPQGLAWPLEPNTDFVIQGHFRPVEEPVDVRIRVGFHFADEPPERTPILLHLTNRTMDIPPGESEYVVEDRFEVPVDVEILGLYPHAHYIARTMELTAELPDGARRTLLRIDEWDFDWQDSYPFAEPVTLPAGTVLKKRYVYDNSADNPRNPNDPPERIVYGPNSDDEMAELWIQALARDEAEFDVLDEAVYRKAARDHVRGWEHLVDLNPDDGWAHANLAAVYERQGRIDESLEHYRKAVELEADFEQAHFNLGLLLEERGRLEEARHHYRETVRAFPQHAGAHNNLGNLYHREGRLEEAERHYRLSIEADPDHAEAHVNLGNMAREEGRFEEALDAYRRAVEVRPGSPEIRFNLAFNLILLGRPDEALEHLGVGARLAPQELQPRLAAAWMLATHPDPGFHRPDAAIELAEGVRGALTGEHPLVLDVLAAGHAAAGRFERAAELADDARDLAARQGDDQLASEIGHRLELYRQGRPFTAPPQE